jgi:hypothetical protein
VERKAIDGIWFIWPAEHNAKLLAALQALPQDEYDQKVTGG